MLSLSRTVIAAVSSLTALYVPSGGLVLFLQPYSWFEELLESWISVSGSSCGSSVLGKTMVLGGWIDWLNTDFCLLLC